MLPQRKALEVLQYCGLLGVRYRMVKAARERGLIFGVWFGGPKEKSEKNKSVEYTCDRLHCVLTCHSNGEYE